MQSLQRFSQQPQRLAARGPLKPAWPDVPYHFYIGADGQIAEGRDTAYAGDTNTDYDPTGHILIVLEGNFEREMPSGAQSESLYRLASWIADEWQIQTDEIKGHKDYASTLCPGRNLEAQLPALRLKIQTGRGASVKAAPSAPPR
jgi:N-acetyl-anhydromuramyl-L-alanine amidase AmpD